MTDAVVVKDIICKFLGMARTCLVNFVNTSKYFVFVLDDFLVQQHCSLFMSCCENMHGMMCCYPPHLRWGLCSIIKNVLKIQPYGLLVGGPPCGSWVFINKATSRRSPRRIFGDCSRSYVRSANTNLDSIFNQTLAGNYPVNSPSNARIYP